MRFVKAIWKLLIGIKDVLVLLLMLLFFAMLYAVMSARPTPVTDGVLALDLRGVIVEQPSRPGLSELAAGQQRMREYSRRDIVAALDEARQDGRVKAVALDLEGFAGGGQAALGSVADAIRRVRDSGKPVLAYSVGYTDSGYQLASAASEIWLNPLGAVVITGPGGARLYFQGLLDQLGITAHIYRVGTHKAAVEPLTRNDMSDEAREDAQGIGDALLESWLETVARARPRARLQPYVRDLPAAVEAAGGDFGRAALSAAMVDTLADRRAYEARLAELGGKDRASPGGYQRIKLDSYVRERIKDNPRAPIGVVTVAGMIIDGQAGPGTAGGDSIAEILEIALGDDSLKALVVRVDSPGGSVLASERIRQAILAAKDKKMPVVVSMGNVAASGGYWVATPADFIYAEPSTITGSIGVFGILPSFEGTRDKLGIGADGIKTTPLSGEPDVMRGPSPEVERLLQAGVESVYRRFLTIVSEARRKPPAEIDRIAQGRVWAGGAAHQIGLIDGFGGMDEAIAKAAELASLKEANRQVRYLERPRTLRESLLDMFATSEESGGPADAFAAFAAPQRQLVSALGELRLILAGPTIQAHCLDCPPSALQPSRASDTGLLALLRSWFA